MVDLTAARIDAGAFASAGFGAVELCAAFARYDRRLGRVIAGSASGCVSPLRRVWRESLKR